MSGSHLVSFADPLNGAQADALRRHVFYLDEGIESFHLVDGALGVTGVEVVLPDGSGDATGIAEKVRRLVDRDLRGLRDVPQRILWETAGSQAPREDVWPALLESGAAVEMGPGLVALGEPLLRLMDHLDCKLRDLVREQFSAVEYRYPTLLPTSAVDRCGYFESFPQFLMFTTRLHADINGYEEARFARVADRERWILDQCAGVENVLPPTMCFHTYAHLAGRRFAPGESSVVTSRGKSFRFESRYASGLERLWDFTIRETVFLGDRGFVRNRRRGLLDAARELVAELGLPARCEVATDPFFADADRAPLAATQVLTETKYELRMPVENERTIAVASFNYADSFFTDRFDIRDTDGEPLRSGCVGFGLERLAYAFVSTHGVDPVHWPDDVAADCRS